MEKKLLNSQRILGVGALTSAFITSFCWQIGLILASFGLGSLAVSVWIAEYKWVFIILTFVFLGLAFIRIRKMPSRWSKLLFYGTTALSVGLVVYSKGFK